MIDVRVPDEQEGTKPQEVPPGTPGDRETRRQDLNASSTEMHGGGRQT